MPGKKKPLIQIKAESLSNDAKANIQKRVCKKVMSVSDVMKSQVMNEVIQHFSKSSDNATLAKAKASIENVINQNANIIVDTVLDETK